MKVTQLRNNAMENIFRMSLFMPPISPIRDKISGKNLRNATLTPTTHSGCERSTQTYHFKRETCRTHPRSTKRRTAGWWQCLPPPEAADTALRDSLRSLHSSAKWLHRRSLRTGSSGHRPSWIYRRSRKTAPTVDSTIPICALP